MTIMESNVTDAEVETVISDLRYMAEYGIFDAVDHGRYIDAASVADLITALRTTNGEVEKALAHERDAWAIFAEGPTDDKRRYLSRAKAATDATLSTGKVEPSEAEIERRRADMNWAEADRLRGILYVNGIDSEQEASNG